MSSKALALLTALALGTPTGRALAAPTPLPPAAVAPTESAPEPEGWVWYGSRLMLADGASLALGFAGAVTSTGPVALTGLGGMVLGAPVVHLVEGQRGRALGSLGLRLVLPIAGGALAAWSEERGNKGGECNCMGGALAFVGGMALGMGVAMVVDAAFLGWRYQPATTRQTSVSVIPSFALAPGGGSVGLAGRF
jgi:hypothetical protein